MITNAERAAGALADDLHHHQHMHLTMTKEPESTKPESADEDSELKLHSPGMSESEPESEPESESEQPAESREPDESADPTSPGSGGEQFTEFARSELQRIETEVKALEERIQAIEGDKYLLNLQAESLRMYLGARSGNPEADADADASVAADAPPGGSPFDWLTDSHVSRSAKISVDPGVLNSMTPARPRSRMALPNFSLGSRQRSRTADQSDAIADAAFEVLNEMDDQDMHYHDLTDRVRRKIGDFAGNLNSARVQLNSALNADGRFVRPFRRGRYALRKNYPRLRRSVGERLRPRPKSDDDDASTERD